MNIIVIANCHVQPICDGLILHPQVQNVHPVPIHLLNTIHLSNAINLIKKSNKKNFTILQFNDLLSQIDLGEDVLSRVDKILSFTNIYFSGLHPDLTYVGQLGKRITSPLGDYHSKLCLLSFLKGYSVDNCIKLFNESTFEKLGYFNQWDISVNELKNRDDKLDIQFASIFLSILKNEPTLFTVNHPIGSVFHRFLILIFEKLDLDTYSFPSYLFYNHLASNAWWPIYKEIIDHHKITYSSSFIFKSPDHISRRFFNLDQFISQSYKSYLDQGINIINLPANDKHYMEII